MLTCVLNSTAVEPPDAEVKVVLPPLVVPDIPEPVDCSWTNTRYTPPETTPVNVWSVKAPFEVLAVVPVSVALE